MGVEVVVVVEMAFDMRLCVEEEEERMVVRAFSAEVDGP